ncbi:MAG: KorB domain-containing protein [Caldimonas sp.]
MSVSAPQLTCPLGGRPKASGVVRRRQRELEPPDWLLELYRQGRCRGMAELYELRRLHGEQPEKVEAWTATQASISRNRISELRGVRAPARRWTTAHRAGLHSQAAWIRRSMSRQTA